MSSEPKELPPLDRRRGRWWWCLVLPAACAATAPGPAASAGGHETSYPRRASGCELAVYYTAVPGVAAWDDLGVAEAACRIDDAVIECLRRLKSEACQMGGDVIYDVPRRPLRPRDQVLVYRARVAHTRLAKAKKAEDSDLPPPASPEEAAGPVVPLPKGRAEDSPAGAPDAGVSTAPLDRREAR